MQHISKKRVVLPAFVLAVLGLIFAAYTAHPSYAGGQDGSRIYDSVPDPFPANYPSLGYQATSTKEFGDHIQFAGTGRNLSSVVVGMSSWACENNQGWNSGNCLTPNPNATFTHPITLNLYNVDTSGLHPQPGTLIKSVTQTFSMPYRPSPDPTCATQTNWRNPSDNKCYSGYAFTIEFDLSSENITVPNEIIFGIAYNTNTHGYNPIGSPGPYDALNVGVADPSQFFGSGVGTNVDPDDVFLNSTWAGAYCSGNSTPTGVFRWDGPCWGGYVPVARFNIEPADVSLSISNSLICGGPQTISIDFSNVYDLYGYEFEVEYDVTKVNAVGAFNNSWYDTTGAIKPWNATCSAGTCRFSVAKELGTPVSGAGTVATITLSPVASGSFTAKIKNVTLSTIDGWEIPANIQNNGEVNVNVCGNANVSGRISLQGRVKPMNAGTVTLIDTGGNFSNTVVAFDADGNYSATVPVMPAGSSYKIQASHFLYLSNERAAALWAPGATVAASTRLLGGDADNDATVDITDIGCIGADFGGTSNPCNSAPNSGTDINNDGTVNIQDLSIAGGNYNKSSYQPW